MNIDIAYKGLKYIIVFGVIYFIVKYTAGNDMKEIDIALVASVLTLLLCVLENLVFVDTTNYNQSDAKNNVRENMGIPQTNTASGDLTVTGNMTANAGTNTSTSGVPTTNTKNNVIVTGADRSSLSDNASISSASSSASNMSSSSVSSLSNNPNANPKPTPASFVSPISTQPPRPKPTIPNQKQIGDVNAPNPSQSSNIFIGTDFQTYSKSEEESDEPIDSLYNEKDYLGQDVTFDANDFGGTNTTDIVVDDLTNTGLTQPTLSQAIEAAEKKIPSNTANTSNTSNSSNSINSPISQQNQVQNKNKSGGLIRPDNALADVTPSETTSSTFDAKSGNGKQLNDGKKITVDIQPSTNNATGGIKVPSQPSILNRVSPSGKPLKWYEQAWNPRQYSYAENLDQIAVSGGRTRNDILVNEMIYSDFNRLPPSFNDNDFEYGYSFLPPKDWYPLPPYPPVCVSSCKPAPVTGVYLDSTTMNLQEWHEARKFTPPDSFNTSYLTNEMNSKY